MTSEGWTWVLVQCRKVAKAAVLAGTRPVDGVKGSEPGVVHQRRCVLTLERMAVPV